MFCSLASACCSSEMNKGQHIYELKHKCANSDGGTGTQGETDLDCEIQALWFSSFQFKCSRFPLDALKNKGNPLMHHEPANTWRE